MRHTLFASIVCVLVLLDSLTVLGQQAPPAGASAREIVRLQEDLYLARDGGQHTVFLVTSEGIVLGDPLTEITARWLREELTSRFQTDVRFVLHGDHTDEVTAGSPVFSGADHVAHSSFEKALAQARNTNPARYAFAYRTTVNVGRQGRISLGGRLVLVVHTPTARFPELLSFYFPRERVVFARRPPGIGTRPFDFQGNEPGGVFAWIDAVRALDFDSLVLGDGRVLTRGEFDELARYLSALKASVESGARQGKSLRQIQTTDSPEGFRANPHYVNRLVQLSDVWMALERRYWRAYVGATATEGRLSADFCRAQSSCTTGGAVAGARFGMAITGVKGLEFAAEMWLNQQAWSARTSPEVAEEVASRRSSAALLIRWTPRQGAWSFSLLGGVSGTYASVEGLDQVKGKLLPSGGSHPISHTTVTAGITGGIDLERRVSNGLLVRVPVRLTRTLRAGRSDYDRRSAYDTMLAVQVGMDLVFNFTRRVSVR